MDVLDIRRIRSMDATAWYDFLRDEYFRWKCTAPNRYATATRQLHRYVENGALHSLLHIKERLLAVYLPDVGLAPSTAREIRGMGTAGASGLLALMYPEAFGTVDQFAVEALRGVPELLEAPLLARMKPDGLTVTEASCESSTLSSKKPSMTRRAPGPRRGIISGGSAEVRHRQADADR